MPRASTALAAHADALLVGSAVVLLLRSPVVPARVLVTGVVVVGLRLDSITARREAAAARRTAAYLRADRDQQLALAFLAGQAKREAEGCECATAAGAR